MMPFYQNWKGIEKLSNEELCRAILSCQNEYLLVEIGMLCLKIQETFEAVAHQTRSLLFIQQRNIVNGFPLFNVHI